MNTTMKEEQYMEKKPAYQSPKVSSLDEKEILHGQQAPECASNGSGALGVCFSNGQSAGQDIDAQNACVAQGNSPLFAVIN